MPEQLDEQTSSLFPHAQEGLLDAPDSLLL